MYLNSKVNHVGPVEAPIFENSPYLSPAFQISTKIDLFLKFTVRQTARRNGNSETS